MAREKSPLLETSKALNEYIKASQDKQIAKEQKAIKEQNDMRDHIFAAREAKRDKMRSYARFSESVKNELYSEVLTTIMVTAIGEETALTPEAQGLCHSLVDNFIKENGGAAAIMSRTAGRSYLLDAIRCIVEGTHDSIMEEVDPDEQETQDVPEEKKSEMYDELNKEDDIENAVKVIAQRITDAEEEFIKKNQEDKKTLEDIAAKFSERIKNVEQDSEVAQSKAETDEEAEEEKKEAEETVAQESRIAKQTMNKVKSSRSSNVFEQVVNNLTTSIVSNEALLESYSEEGKLDMDSVMESAKCIYGLLETLNTLRIVNVTPDYIKDTLKSM